MKEILVKLDKIIVQQEKQQEKLDKIEVQQKKQQEKLDKIETQQEKMQKKLDKIEVQQEKHQERLERLEQQQLEMKQDIRKMNQNWFVFEQEYGRKIDAIFDVVSLEQEKNIEKSKKIHKLDERVERNEANIFALDKKVFDLERKHS